MAILLPSRGLSNRSSARSLLRRVSWLRRVQGRPSPHSICDLLPFSLSSRSSSSTLRSQFRSSHNILRRPLKSSIARPWGRSNPFSTSTLLQCLNRSRVFLRLGQLLSLRETRRRRWYSQEVKDRVCLPMSCSRSRLELLWFKNTLLLLPLRVVRTSLSFKVWGPLQSLCSISSSHHSRYRFLWSQFRV